MDRARIERDMGGSNDRTPTLDRAWDATRPAELSAGAFDRIWADVQRDFDARPATLAMRPAAPAWRRSMTLAAAAAALVAGGMLIRPAASPRPEVVLAAPEPAPVVVARHDVETDEVVMVEIGVGNKVEERRFQSQPEANSSLALLDVPANNPSDMLAWAESQSQ